jgi:cyanate permease
MSVRTYWAVGQSDAGLVFTLVGLGGIVLVAVAGWLLRRRDYDRPWMMLGALSMIVGLVTMPMWPPP